MRPSPINESTTKNGMKRTVSPRRQGASKASGAFQAWLRPIACCAFVACSAFATTGSAADAELLAASQIADLSLEELANIRVTSVTGRPRPAQQLAASIFVITQDDIRRSTAASLPEALRLAPNLQVARLNANQWAISARGFNNTIGNKLLVLIDGRTIYSPLFSGVFWDTHEVVVRDVERIEVISGPGATLWGANAVNGVINVITRSAFDTDGSLVQAEAGEAGHQLTGRQGGRLDNDGAWRAYAMQIERDSTRLQTGQSRTDGMRKEQAGFRADWGRGRKTVTVQGDLYQGEGEGTSNLSPELSGGNLLARLQQTEADGSNWQVQAYFDMAKRYDDVIFRDDTHTVDLQFNQEPVIGDRHRLIWGFGHREARSRTEPTALVRFTPEEKSLRWSNVFVQNEWSATPQLRLTAGLKAERNVYTGTELLPTLRVSYELAETQVLWASASRAVRAPARLDREFFFPANPPFLIQGGPEFDSEVAKVFELGYRSQPGPGVSYSATVYRHNYERLRAGRASPTFVENRARGHVDGVEMWGGVDLHPRWRVSGGWVHLSKSLTADALSPASSVPNLGNDPKNQWMLRSTASPTDSIEADATLRRVSSLPEPVVPSYTVIDLRLGWRITDTLEASLLVNNLGNRRHVEFNPNESSEFGRSARVRISWAPR